MTREQYLPRVVLAVAAILCATVVALSAYRPPLLTVPGQMPSARSATDAPASDPGGPSAQVVSIPPTPAASPSGGLPAATPSGTPQGAPTVPAIPIHGTVFIDPGHGGIDTGTLGYTSDGREVMEKTVALAIALRTAALLRAAGVTVVLSRTSDTLPGVTAADLTPDGQSLTPQGVLDELQARINAANASGASLLLSIHLNAFSDPSVGGAETFYDPARPFAANNLRLATLVQQATIAALHAAGYATPDRGIINDEQLQTESVGALPPTYDHLVMLGPAVPGQLTPSQMPGVLTEPLFLSDPAEANVAVYPAVQQLLAGAYARAIEQYLTTTPTRP